MFFFCLPIININCLILALRLLNNCLRYLFTILFNKLSFAASLLEQIEFIYLSKANGRIDDNTYLISWWIYKCDNCGQVFLCGKR